MQAAKDFAIQKFAKDLLDSVDNLDRALAAVPEESRKPEKNKELADLYEGIKMTEGILLKTLKKHGLERTDPVGEKFDPNVHEATFHVHMPGKEPNEVFHVQQKGFVLNGRVLRVSRALLSVCGVYGMLILYRLLRSALQRLRHRRVFELRRISNLSSFRCYHLGV